MVEKSHSPEQDDGRFWLQNNDSYLAEEYRLPKPNYFNEDVTDEERAAMKSWEDQHPLGKSKMTTKKWQKNWYAALDELRLQRAREQVEKAAESPTDNTES
ncbi:hypothetical protein [Amycolatopsis sp. NPDC003731]